MVTLLPALAVAALWASASGVLLARYVWPWAYRGRLGATLAAAAIAGSTLAALVEF